MEEPAKKKKTWKFVAIAIGIYLVIYVLMSLLGKLLEKYGQPGAMVGFTPNLPIMMANLGILIWILNKLLYKPVLNFMEERNNRILRQIQEAESDRSKAKTLLSETEKELERIRKASSGMLREARESAQNERSRLVSEAQIERTRIQEDTEREIGLQVEKAKAELRNEVADLAVKISQQVITQSLSQEDLRRMAEESLVQMEQQTETWSS